MFGPWNSVVPWLRNKTEITALIPPDKIYYRRVKQPENKPYVLVTPGFNYDNGNVADGVLSLKQAMFRVIIVGKQQAHQVEVVGETIKLLLEQVINTEFVGGGFRWWIGSFRLDDCREADFDAVDSDELGIVTIDQVWNVGFYGPPRVIT